MSQTNFIISAEQNGKTLEAILRGYLPGYSWNQVRKVIEARRVRVEGALCVEGARRMKLGESVELLAQSAPPPKPKEELIIRYLDEHLVVVEKPSGLATVRHPAELKGAERLEDLPPTLQELVPPIIARREGRPRRGPLPQLRVVQRLDKETSGLVVFARTIPAESELGAQFMTHSVTRRYLAIVPGYVTSQRIVSKMVRDRGDGRRGSSANGLGKEAITNVEAVEYLKGYTILSCRLETGRTHQIRIHLAELGHPLCGEEVYNRRVGAPPTPDLSGAPRLALHATELGFTHPETQQEMHWEMALPEDLERFIARLREQAK